MLIESWTKDYTVAEVVKIVLDHGIPAGPIYDLKQIVEDEHIAKVRKMFIEIDHPVIGKMRVNGNPVKMMETMPEIYKPAPTLGQDNNSIYHNMLGYSAEQLKLFESDGVI